MNRALTVRPALPVPPARQTPSRVPAPATVARVPVFTDPAVPAMIGAPAAMTIVFWMATSWTTEDTIATVTRPPDGASFSATPTEWSPVVDGATVLLPEAVRSWPPVIVADAVDVNVAKVTLLTGV